MEDAVKIAATACVAVVVLLSAWALVDSVLRTIRRCRIARRLRRETPEVPPVPYLPAGWCDHVSAEDRAHIERLLRTGAVRFSLPPRVG